MTWGSTILTVRISMVRFREWPKRLWGRRSNPSRATAMSWQQRCSGPSVSTQTIVAFRGNTLLRAVTPVLDDWGLIILICTTSTDLTRRHPWKSRYAR